MKFEDIVKKVSSFVAAFIVFFIAAGMYLSWKGFVMQPDGRIVLVKQANAAIFDDEAEEDIAQPLDSKIALSLPKGPVLGSAEAPLNFLLSAAPTAQIFTSVHCPNWKPTISNPAN